MSAKESDGSIDLAMQTLIRHLADKHLEALYGEEYRKRGKKKHRKPKPNKAGVDTSLKFTGVEEVTIKNYPYSVIEIKLTKMRSSITGGQYNHRDTHHTISSLEIMLP